MLAEGMNRDFRSKAKGCEGLWSGLEVEEELGLVHHTTPPWEVWTPEALNQQCGGVVDTH